MVMLRSILENRNISCRSHLVYVLLQSILLSACCTNFSTSNGSRGWRPNIVKKQLNLVVLETLVKLMANKAPSMKSSQSFLFSSMPFLRMSSYCFRPESDILSLTSVSLYPDPIGCKIGKKSVWWKGKRWEERLLISPSFPPFFFTVTYETRGNMTLLARSQQFYLIYSIKGWLQKSVKLDAPSPGLLSLVISVSLTRKHISSVICVPV